MTFRTNLPWPGTRTILCRAVDDSGNLEAPAAGVTVTVSEEA